MTNTSDVDAILEQLTGEFLESCEESLVAVDDTLSRLMDANGDCPAPL